MAMGRARARNGETRFLIDKPTPPYHVTAYMQPSVGAAICTLPIEDPDATTIAYACLAR